MQDRPAATEMMAAVREFLQQEIVPTIDDQRLRFRTLIACNVLAILERELDGEDARLWEEWERLVALSGEAPGRPARPATLAELRAAITARTRALCERIAAGEADDGPWRRAVLEHVRWSVTEKLRIANPRYTASFTPPAPAGTSSDKHGDAMTTDQN